MAIRSIIINNILAFHNQSHNMNQKENNFKNNTGAFQLLFCDGINVLIGENGTGKTSVLKMIYAATQWSILQFDERKTKRISYYFSPHLKDESALKTFNHQTDECSFIVSDGEHDFVYMLSNKCSVDMDKWADLNYYSVYIPASEMLSHSKGFLAMNEKFNMPFDGTQIDIVVNASLPEMKVITPTMEKILQKLSAVIHGTVEQRDDVFYVVKENGQRVDFSLEAEGFRKIGLLWKLARNGLLEPGTVLLWDEPEANLNPELYPVLVDVLVELQKCGVQIFVATHSYNFAKYLEISSLENEQILFHNLYWSDDVYHYENGLLRKDERKTIRCESNKALGDLQYNHIMDADEKLLNKIYDFRGIL